MNLWTRRAVISFFLGLGAPAIAQHGIQQKRISQFSMQIRSVKEGRKVTCLSWLPLTNAAAEARYLNINPRGEETVTVQFSVLFNTKPEQCKLVFANESVQKIAERSHHSGKTIFDYSVTFEAPVTVVRATTNEIEEDLVFDAPIDVASDRGFFDFFYRSTVYFENRLAILSTDSPLTTIKSVPLLPVFGGKISTPLPYLNSWFGGYSLFQNLGAILPTQGVEVAYSEFVFDLTYQRVLNRLGMQVGLGAELRGRNVYQVENERPFLVGQVLRPGLSAKLDWFPSFYSALGSTKFRFGLGLEYHYLNLSDVKTSGIKQQTFELSLNYRVSKRGSFVVGLGYSKFLQSIFIPAVVTDRRINENTQNFFLRLILFPVHSKEAL
jgi:hypothetical protein